MRLAPLVASAVVAGALVACAGGATTREPAHEVIDHVILGISDLDRGIADLAARTGVTATFGGAHPKLGTHNALMSLGPGRYLEIIAPRPDTTVDARLADLGSLAELTPGGWAVATKDAEATVRRLEAAGYAVSPIQPGSRTKPDGTTLTWKTFGIVSPAMPMAPFFIEWGADTVHPSASSPGGCTLETPAIATGQDVPLAGLLDTIDVEATVVHAATDAMAISLACSGRRVTFGEAGDAHR